MNSQEGPASMVMPKASIVVPVYNCEKTLNCCIESILRQSHADFEIILVDDGSIDQSLRICRQFELLDKRIKVFHKTHSGASATRNLGMLKASGDYLMFVDADDYIEPEMLERLMISAEKENADIVICGMTLEYKDAQGKQISACAHNLRPVTVTGNKKIAESVIDLVENSRINSPCGKLIKRAIIEKNGLKMPEHIVLQEDLYFNIRILEHANKLVIIDGSYYHYVKTRSDSLTNRFFMNKYDMGNEVHDLLLNYYSERCSDQKIIGRIKSLYIKHVFATAMNLFHPKSQLNRREKILHLLAIKKSEKFQKLIKSDNIAGLKCKLLQWILSRRSFLPLYYTSALASLWQNRI